MTFRYLKTSFFMLVIGIVIIASSFIPYINKKIFESRFKDFGDNDER